MPRHSTILFILATLCLTAGCAPLRPASPAMFYGNCITSPGNDLCDSAMPICQVYEDVIDRKYATSGACRTACSQAYATLSFQYQVTVCGTMVDRGLDLCEQQCLRQYPVQQ